MATAEAPVVTAVLNDRLKCRLWELYPTPAVARAANDKRLAQRLALAHDWALAEAALVSSIDELDDRIAALQSSEGWVVKVPFSAAGRDRMQPKRMGLKELIHAPVGPIGSDQLKRNQSE